MTVAAAAALVTASIVAAPAAFATENANDLTKGNADTECQSAGYAYGIKLDTGIPGTYSYPGDSEFEGLGHAVQVDVTISDDGIVSFANADPPVAAVLIKAANHYDVFPFDPPVTEYSGLEPSITQGISHVTLCYQDYRDVEQLSVEKTAVTSYHRTHKWLLTKSADKSDVKLYAPGGAGSGSATVSWTVGVAYDGYTDSDLTVSGSITVTNTGTPSAGLTGVLDAMVLDATQYAVSVSCPGVTFSLGEVAFLDHGESLTCTYSVTGGFPRKNGTNHVSVTTLSGHTYESNDAPVVWSDDPTTETNKTVTVTDVSGLNGTTSQSFTAPNGGSLNYSKTLQWSGYPQCGDYSHQNTATLTTGYENTVLDTKSTTLNVHVQCRTFSGETAWAANGQAGKDRYVKQGNWATYVTYANLANPLVPMSYPVFAGQNMPAGTATITPVGGGKVTVTVDLSGPWEFTSGSGDNMMIQNYASAPNTTPSPGLFAFKKACTTDPCTSAQIPVSKYYGIHLQVGRWIPDPNF